MTSAVTQVEAEERCLANGFAWPDGVVYKNNYTKYPLICLTCGDDTPKGLNTVGRHGCKKCFHVAKGLAKMLPHDEVVDRGLAALHPALLLEEYKGKGVKHLYRFFECGHEWEISPENLHKGKSCGACAYDQGATYVYLLQRGNILKVGVTSVEHKKPTNCRIHQLGTDGFSLVHKAEHKTRKEALTIEKLIVDSRNGGPALKPGDMKYDGYGETFFKDQVDVNQIVRMMA